MYDTWEYANSRLNGTIVRLKGVPIYVQEVGPSMTVRYYELCGDSEKTCKVKDLDLEPVPLGFYNCPRGAVYVSRQPKREDWRQGLRDNTINQRPKRDWRITHSNLLEAINGVQMSLQEAAAASTKSKIMVAFHRYWAIEGSTLYHKWRPVGTIYEGRPTFATKYEYLYSRYVEDCGDGSN